MAAEIISKRCCSCKQTKPISEFHKNRSKKDGFATGCKSCRIIEITKYRKTEKGKATHRKESKKYKKTLKGKAIRKRYQQGEKGKASRKRFVDRHPNQLKAKNAVNNAITAGKLPRPDSLLCHYCSILHRKPAQQYHHWKGYEPEHWLDVVPVCLDCHSKYQK